VDVLQQQKPHHEPRLGRRRAFDAEALGQFAIDPGPVDCIGQADQLVLQVDDPIELRPEQIARARRLRLLRSHRKLSSIPQENHGSAFHGIPKMKNGLQESEAQATPSWQNPILACPIK